VKFVSEQAGNAASKSLTKSGLTLLTTVSTMSYVLIAHNEMLNVQVQPKMHKL